MPVRIQSGELAATIDPDFGNNAFSLTVGGREVMWTPGDFRTKPDFGGIPLLAPWANRIDQLAYWANGHKFLINEALGNLHFDHNHLPMHGMLAFAGGWRTVRQTADAATHRLEFWRFPEWMAQFPFAHVIEIMHRLKNGTLEVETAVENLSNQPMPLSIGYHPYFRLDSPREQSSVYIAAREEVVLNDHTIPTGEKKPLKHANPFPLAGAALDNVFSGLTGEDFVIESGARRITVKFGPKYPVAIIYSPHDAQFVCIEPMSALTDAFNLDHAGIDAGLQHIAPGDTWRESFWVTPA